MISSLTTCKSTFMTGSATRRENFKNGLASEITKTNLSDSRSASHMCSSKNEIVTSSDTYKPREMNIRLSTGILIRHRYLFLIKAIVSDEFRVNLVYNLSLPSEIPRKILIFWDACHKKIKTINQKNYP
mgnify:CR=1 FL=1